MVGQWWRPPGPRPVSGDHDHREVPGGRELTVRESLELVRRQRPLNDRSTVEYVAERLVLEPYAHQV